MPVKVKLSASSIGSFKACPMRYYFNYIRGLVPVEDTDSQRQGTNWHKLLDVYFSNGNATSPAFEYLADVYSSVPDAKTREEWLVERNTLLYALSAYDWYHNCKDYELVASELPFELPLVNPKTGRKLSGASLCGRIDKLVRNKHGILFVMEHKSTSKPIDPDSSYWNKLILDTQTTLYTYAARALGYDATGVIYDVFHRPGLSPSMLTQANTKILLETGKYLDNDFTVKQLDDKITVNDEQAEVKKGKRDIAIRETPDLFATRLLADMTERPEFYFHRRELAKTDSDIVRMQRQLYNILKAIRSMASNEGWYTDETQCEATFRCPYTKICYSNIDIDLRVPDGFRIRRS